VPGAQYRFNLNSSSAAVTVTAACVRRYTQGSGQVAQGPAPQPAAPPAQAAAPPSPSPQSAAAATAAVTGSGRECEILKRALSGNDPVIDGPADVKEAKLDTSYRWPGTQGDGTSNSAGKGRYMVSYNTSDKFSPNNKADYFQEMFLKQVQSCMPGV